MNRLPGKLKLLCREKAFMPRPKKEKEGVVSSLTASRRHLSIAETLEQANTSPTLQAGFLETGASGLKAVLHQEVAILEFASPTVLEEVLRGTPLLNYVVQRLGAQALVIDQARQDEILRFLTNQGYEPRVLAW